jgi:hypothetical protein
MEWTYYQPPKSQGFGHVATPRNPLAAWNVLETFIKDHAITNEWFPTGLTIDVRPEFWTPSALEGVLATLTALEGPYEWGSRVLADLLAEIAPKLPITLRPNYFRRAVVNKRGNAFKFLRTASKAT